jgi:hypothetical protein
MVALTFALLAAPFALGCSGDDSPPQEDAGERDVKFEESNDGGPCNASGQICFLATDCCSGICRSAGGVASDGGSSTCF